MSIGSYDDRNPGKFDNLIYVIILVSVISFLGWLIYIFISGIYCLSK